MTVKRFYFTNNMYVNSNFFSPNCTSDFQCNPKTEINPNNTNNINNKYDATNILQNFRKNFIAKIISSARV